MMSQTLCRAGALHLFRQYQSPAPDAPPELTPRGLSAVQGKLLQEYIAANLDGQLTLAVLAPLAGLSQHNFLDAFRQTFKTTPAQYIIAQRLRHARRLLADSKQAITEIALESGFASHSHLSATFKARTGVTPQEFRLAQHGK